MIRPLDRPGKLIRREPLKHDTFRPPASMRRVSPVTVCIAARSGPSVIGASDRMLTSGDIQFEPPVTSKIEPLTRSIVVMQAGDAAFNTEIMREVAAVVQQRVKDAPNDWWFVKDVADLYVSQRNLAKLKKAEAALLAPIGLNRDTFLSNHRQMNDGVVEQLTRDLINYDVPYASVIIIGVDTLGPHIYVVDDGNISCNDVIGFAAIGIGARHPESQLMLGRHGWNAPLADTVLLVYAAKKRSEIAPGVGEATDMFAIGPGLGSYDTLSEEAMQRFDEIYRKMRKTEEQCQRDARKEANDYVNEATARRASKQPEIQQEPPHEGQTPLETQEGVNGTH